MFQFKNIKIKKVLIYMAIPTVLALAAGFGFREDIINSYKQIRNASAEGFQYHCYSTDLNSNFNVSQCGGYFSFSPNQNNRIPYQVYCAPEGTVQTINSRLNFAVSNPNANPATADGLNKIVDASAVQNTTSPYPSTALNISPASSTFNTSVLPSPSSNTVSQSYNVSITNPTISAAQIRQSYPVTITGRYSWTSLSTTYNFSDAAYAIIQSDHANVAPQLASPTGAYSNFVATPSSTDNVPIQFTVTDAESNLTNLVLELSSDNFATILQSQTFSAQTAGTTINYTFTNVPVGSYSWRVRGIETNAAGACGTITDVRYPMNFKLTYANAVAPDTITVTTAPTKGVISACSTVTQTCIYTPNTGVANTATTDTFVVTMTKSGSSNVVATYTVDFNPNGLPTPIAGVNLNSNTVSNTIVISTTQADLQVLKKLTAGSTLISNTVASYDFTVTNGGPNSATGPLSLVDTLPAGLTFSNTTPSGASNNGWTCSASGQTVTCTNPGSLANGANSSFVMKVNVA